MWSSSFPMPAPAHEAVVEGLVRTVAARRVLPLEPTPDHVDDAADHPAVVDAAQATRQGKERRDPAHVRDRRQRNAGHRIPPTDSESHRFEPCNTNGPNC